MISQCPSGSVEIYIFNATHELILGEAFATNINVGNVFTTSGYNHKLFFELLLALVKQSLYSSNVSSSLYLLVGLRAASLITFTRPACLALMPSDRKSRRRVLIAGLHVKHALLLPKMKPGITTLIPHNITAQASLSPIWFNTNVELTTTHASIRFDTL